MVRASNGFQPFQALGIQLDAHQMYVVTVVSTYWFVSISMVYLNKILMSNDGISIPAPLFVTWFQCVVTALICYGAGMVGEYQRKQDTYQALSKSQEDDEVTESLLEKGGEGGGAVAKAEPVDSPPPKSFFNQFPKAEYKIGVGQKVFPLSLVFVGMITFNNLCLRWVEVSFYNVARSLTIVFNVVFTAVMLGGHTSQKVMLSLAIVIFGFFIGSSGELNFSFRGTIAGVISSLFVSLNSIYTKKVLPVVDNDSWKLTYYNNINACVLFIPLILIFEHAPIAAGFSKQFLSTLFWFAMLVAGFFGFSIGIVTVLQIKATSPLSHNISGTAKAAVQSILAFYLWGNTPTVMGVLGIFTVLGGSLLYTIVKMNEGNSSGPAPSSGSGGSGNSSEKETDRK
jgi:solute carrier family 35 (GDP-fucose transporter), member C1